MGFLSNIAKVALPIAGTFFGGPVGGAIGGGLAGLIGNNSANKGLDQTGKDTLALQQKGLDYAMNAIDPRLQAEQQARDKALGFYMGDGSSFIDEAKSSPFYQSMLDQGRQGVASSLSTTGNLRGGMGKEAFYNQDQRVLQNLVNQKLAGLQNYSRPTDISAIPNLYNQQSNTVADIGTAKNQLKQDQSGNLIKLGTTIAGMI